MEQFCTINISRGPKNCNQSVIYKPLKAKFSSCAGKRARGEKSKRFRLFVFALWFHPLPTFVRQLRLQIAFIEFLRDLFASERKSNHAALVDPTATAALVLSKQKERRSEILKAESAFSVRRAALCAARIEFPSPWGIRRRALMTQKCQWNLLNSGRSGGGGRSSSELLCPEIAN